MDVASWYGNRPDSERLKRQAGEWGKALKRFPAADIELACERARGASPRYMPTLPQVEEQLQRIARERQAEREKADRERREARELAAHQSVLSRVPVGEADQEQWIREGRNPCLQLARRWLVESVRRGRRGTETIPVEDGIQRARDLSAAVDAMGGIG